MVSHELRTPLNAILGWSELMMKGGMDTDVIRHGLDVISRNTRIQAQLISDLLDMSRIVSGKLRLTIERIDLASLIRDAIETVQQSADSKRIVFRQDLADSVLVAGDPARLQQIIWNLLWNAIKFTAEGGSVLVGLRHVGSDAEITVTDTGVGIRPEFLPHVFERFQQGNLSITRRFGGLGLGLSIVKHLVDLHGGTIRADSAGEGQGATFTIVLPSSALQDTSSAVVEAAARTESASHSADVLEGIRILVVEDESDTRDFLSRFLAACGAEVVTASSAAEALALLPGARVDLLVSDIGLPDVDGYELLERIRQMAASSTGGIPAIALTAYARAEDRMLAFRAGYQAHLVKPVEPTELVATIAGLAKAAAPRT
jgi:CheY-like chemotaxis protein/two-component sensor histidine kinase